MDFEQKYRENFFELETCTRQIYEKAIKVIYESENPQECFEALNLAFQVFEKSHPVKDKSVEWAGDLIKGYRNLARALDSVILSEQYTLLKELLSPDYEDLSQKFKGETDEETLRKILDHADEFGKLLDKQGVEISDLENILETRNECNKLKERVSVLENL